MSSSSTSPSSIEELYVAVGGNPHSRVLWWQLVRALVLSGKFSPDVLSRLEENVSTGVGTGLRAHLSFSYQEFEDLLLKCLPPTLTDSKPCNENAVVCKADSSTIPVKARQASSGKEVDTMQPQQTIQQLRNHENIDLPYNQETSIDGAFDFSSLRKEKAGQHMPSTREWLFREVRQWYLHQMQVTTENENDTSAAPASDLHIPFWLTGDGGTGKSVVSAVLLERLKEDAVAWHFCRHDNLSQSEPADVLRSMSAMMCARLPGFAEAKAKQPQEKLNLAESSMDLDDIFEPLLAEPLKVLETPTHPKLIVLDALDELPQGPPRTKMLRAITSYFSKLPKWLCLFITSRNEAGIKRALEAKVTRHSSILDTFSQTYLFFYIYPTVFSYRTASGRRTKCARHPSVFEALGVYLRQYGDASGRFGTSYRACIQYASRTNERTFVCFEESHAGIKECI